MSRNRVATWVGILLWLALCAEAGAQHPINVLVPTLSVGDSIVLDASLSEISWAGAATVVFGPDPVTNGYDNEVYEGNHGAESPNLDTFKFLWVQDVTDVYLYVGLTALDTNVVASDVSTGDSPAASDGICDVRIKRGDGPGRVYFRYVWRNSSPGAAPDRTVSSAWASGDLGDVTYSLLGATTVNDASDIDEGYVMEGLIKLSGLGYSDSSTPVPFYIYMWDVDTLAGDPIRDATNAYFNHYRLDDIADWVWADPVSTLTLHNQPSSVPSSVNDSWHLYR